jgi:hypothetical protein
METFTNQSFCPLLFFTKRKKFTSFLSIFLTISLLNLLTGCSYYNVRNLTTTSETLAGQINEFAENQQYVVIHSGQDTWHLSALRINEQEKTISGIVQLVGAKHISKKPRETKTTHQYTGGKEVLNEVHFYISSQKEITYGEQATIPFSEITSISVNDKNTGRTAANIVLGTVGVIAAIFIIVLLTKSSCPFIYVNNGEEYVFTGELYPGVLTANQQRDDYLVLPNLIETNSEYRIKITNELKEIQHTDMVQLMAIEHPENVKVLLDANGNPHTFSNLIAPNRVMVDNLNGDTGPALAKDNTSYLFNTALDNNSSKRTIEMTFNKPEQVAKAKLYLTVKNSLWLDYVFGKFNEKFGTYYPQFQKDQQIAPKENSIKWMKEQSIPLSVYVKTATGWDLVDRINTVGPMASRDIAVPIDMTNLTGNEVVLKLETGFMFWEVDYAGMDFTDNTTVTINYINPSMAVDGNNKDVTKLLLAEDQNYLVQPNVGDQVVVHFKAIETNPTFIKTFFLKNRGYYNYIRNYDSEPNFQELKLFRVAGSFTDFSMYEYEALMDYEHQFDLAENSK